MSRRSASSWPWASTSCRSSRKSDHLKQASLVLMVGIAFAEHPHLRDRQCRVESPSRTWTTSPVGRRNARRGGVPGDDRDSDHGGPGVPGAVVDAPDQLALERAASAVDFDLRRRLVRAGGRRRQPGWRNPPQRDPTAGGERHGDRPVRAHRRQLRARHAVDVGDGRDTALRRAHAPDRRADAGQPAPPRAHAEPAVERADAAAAVGHVRLRRQRDDRHAVLCRRAAAVPTTTRRSTGS